MKSEERHQLLTNDLGVVTRKTVNVFEQHAGTIVAVVCGILVFLAVGFWWTRGAESENAAGWAKLDSAKNLEDFGTVVDSFKGKPPAHWAQLAISEKTLQNALPLLFTNRELAIADVKSAREGFESLIQEKGVVPAVRERALWGFAQCLEAICDGDTSKPIEAYSRLVQEYPDTMFKQVAEEHMISLKRSGSAEFYAWFSKENPKPPEIRPRDGKDDNININLNPAGDEPGEPAIQLPGKEAPAPPEKPATPAEGADKLENAEKPATEKSAEPTTKAPDAEKPPVVDPPKEGDQPNDKK